MITGAKISKEALIFFLGIVSLETPAFAGIARVSVSAEESPLTLERLGALLARRPYRHATFEELQFTDLLTTPIKLKGTLTYIAPDKLEKRVIVPSDERFTVDGETVTYENKGKRINQSFSLESHALLRALTQSLTATFAGDFRTLSTFYLLQLEGDLSQWILRLTPRVEPLSKVVESIVIQGRDETVTRFDLRETTGDYSQMHIVEMRQ